MLPQKQGWALFLLWACAHIGGFLAVKVGLPPLLGMLVVGIILKNIPQGKSPALACTTWPENFPSGAGLQAPCVVHKKCTKGMYRVMVCHPTNAWWSKFRCSPDCRQMRLLW